MRRTLLNLAALLLLTASPLVAETLSSSEYNFAIELPAGWKTMNAPSPAVAAAQNADGQKFIAITAARVPDNERSSTARDMTAGAKEGTKGKGWPITAESQVRINDLSFNTFTARISDQVTVTTWITSAGDKTYSLQGVYKSGDAETDPELRSVLSSFHLLSPVPANTASVDKDSFAYRLGRTLPNFVLLALVVFGVRWTIRRLRRKRA